MSKTNQSSNSEAVGQRKGSSLPLSGIRVLDIATFIAAPFTATTLSEFGAEVVREMKTLLAGIIEKGRSTPGPAQPNDAEIEMIKPVPPPPKRKQVKK